MNDAELEHWMRGRGFVQGPDGSWSKLRRTAVLPRPSGEAPKLERDSRHAALLPAVPQKPLAERVWVRITSFRRRLLDEDNLCAKYVVDCCRYAGLIRDDAPGTAKIEVCQEKVGSQSEEFVRIEIFRR